VSEKISKCELFAWGKHLVSKLHYGLSSCSGPVSGSETAQTRAKLSSMKTLQEEREFCNGFVKGKKGFSKRQVRKLAEGGQDRLVQQHPL
jgi:hypothetical protein